MRFLFWSVMLVVTSYPVSVMTSLEYVAETVVFVDKIGEERWQKKTGKINKVDMETEIQSLMFEVNEIYKNLDNKNVYGIKIRFQIKELTFLKENILSEGAAHEVESNYGAQRFAVHLKTYRPTKFDVAILLTGNQLYLGSFIRAKGFARVGKLCTEHSVGLVKYTGTFDDVITTAHELAHIFDAQHDNGNNCKREGYIMTTYQEFLTKARYDFSTCSKNSIAKKISSFVEEGSNCLLQSDKVKLLKAPRYGTLMTPGAMCKRKFNHLSYVSRQNYSSGYGDDACLKLACRENTRGSWRIKYIPSPDGLYCGKNRQCLQGECVASKTGLDIVLDNCPFGDQPVIEGTFPKGCGQIQPKDCPKFKDACCETCNENNPEFTKTADDECRKLEGLHSQMFRLDYNATDYGQKICSHLSCLKEPHKVNGVWNRKTYKTPDGMACGKNKRCNGGECVEATNGNPRIDDGCPFGDQPFVTGNFNKSCDDIIWRTGCKNGWEKVCCGSCRGKLQIAINK